MISTETLDASAAKYASASTMGDAAASASATLIVRSIKGEVVNARSAAAASASNDADADEEVFATCCGACAVLPDKILRLSAAMVGGGFPTSPPATMTFTMDELARC